MSFWPPQPWVSAQSLYRFLFLKPQPLNPNPLERRHSMTNSSGETFTLRRVRLLPTLPKDVASTVEESLKTILDRGKRLPPPFADFPIR